MDLGSKHLALVVDDEGLLKELKPTCWLYYTDSKKVESKPLVGSVLVVGLDRDEPIGLTDEDFELVKSKVMTNNLGYYFLPMNEEYIKSSNKSLNELFRGLSETGE